MGFGIRVPGVRISTSGVRIGPRVASVRVSTRGVSASVGPRALKVTASRSGVRASTNVGPFRVSSSGFSARARLGPASLRLGSGGASAALSLAPVWISARTSGGHSSGINHPSQEDSEVLQLRRSPQQLVHDFPDRRKISAETQMSLEQRSVHGIHSLLLDVAPALVLFGSFGLPTPDLDLFPSESEIKEAAIHLFNERAQQSEGADLTDSEGEIEELMKVLIDQRNEAVILVNESVQKFIDGDSLASLLCLQLCFADNGGAAAPVGLDDGDLLVFMSFPPAYDMVWPERAVNTFGSEFKHRSASQVVDQHIQAVKQLVAATIREAFEVHPHVQRVRVLVMDWAQSSSAIDTRHVAIDMQASRSDLPSIQNSSLEACNLILEFLSQWWSAHGTGDDSKIMSLVKRWEDGTSGTVSLLSTRAQNFAEHMVLADHSALSPHLRPTVSELLGASSLHLETIDEDDASDEVFQPIFDESDFVGGPVFWIYLALLIRAWNDDSIDIVDLRHRAQVLGSVLGIGKNLNSEDSLPFQDEPSSAGPDDELFQAAIELAKSGQPITVSKLQRELKIGFARAHRLLDLLLEGGYVVPQ